LRVSTTYNQYASSPAFRSHLSKLQCGSQFGRFHRPQQHLGNKGKLVFIALDLHAIHFTKAIFRGALNLKTDGMKKTVLYFFRFLFFFSENGIQILTDFKDFIVKNIGTQIA
jgi:hypothetical protein